VADLLTKLTPLSRHRPHRQMPGNEVPFALHARILPRKRPVSVEQLAQSPPGHSGTPRFLLLAGTRGVSVVVVFRLVVRPSLAHGVLAVVDGFLDADGGCGYGAS
jgi:hypothetical protein